ncbi:MAG: prephenate dehydratase, partial [Nocardioidaceae bacterium]|nr:prephenate dehydratase [Nocardioidaceae bacterium]
MPGVPPARYAYLGPEGTFTEAALRTLPAASRSELLPHPSVVAALDSVRAGDADGAVVPIE